MTYIVIGSLLIGFFFTLSLLEMVSIAIVLQQMSQPRRCKDKYEKGRKEVCNVNH